MRLRRFTYVLVKMCLELAGKLSVGDVLGPLMKVFDFSGNIWEKACVGVATV
jgi:hypothetical protein